MGLTIGVDIGGTKIAAGVVDESGQVLSRARRDTPSHDPGATEDAMAGLVAELRTGYEVEAVGLGAAGFVDADRARVVFAPNLAWRDEPLREAIERRTGLPAVVENDANAAAWGEANSAPGRVRRSSWSSPWANQVQGDKGATTTSRSRRGWAGGGRGTVGR
jgi:glucokinase